MKDPTAQAATPPQAPQPTTTTKRPRRQRQKTGERVVCGWLREEEVNRLDREADRLMSSRSALVNRILREGLKNFPKEAV